MANNNSFAIIDARVVKDYAEERFYDGILIIDGRIAYVGDSATTKMLAHQYGVEIMSKKGLFVLPGFIDSHLHVESLGISIKTVDLSSVNSIDELVNTLRRVYDREKPKVLIGRGWDHENFLEKRMPIAKDLDIVSREVPIVISRICGHVVSVNSLVLDALREELSVFSDNIVPKDEKGRPIGVLFEDAGYLAWDYASSFLDKKEILQLATKRLASLGITSVGWMSVNKSQLNSLLETVAENPLQIRLHLYVEQTLIDEVEEYRKRITSNDFLRINGVKLFADGSLGARTAYLSEEYNDKPGWKGVLIHDEKRIMEITSKIIEHGLQPSVHAIGDEAIRNVLRAYKKVNAGKYEARIEHVSLAFPDILEELARQRIVAVVQPRFVISDWWASYRLGYRVRYLYPFRSMLRYGIKMALSTDSPVEPANPWLTVSAAESERDESLTRKESLYLYTVGSSIALKRRDIGKLDVGYRADFVLVNFNPFTIPRQYLNDASVLETYVEGKKVYPHS